MEGCLDTASWVDLAFRQAWAPLDFFNDVGGLICYYLPFSHSFASAFPSLRKELRRQIDTEKQGAQGRADEERIVAVGSWRRCGWASGVAAAAAAPDGEQGTRAMRTALSVA